MKSITSTWPYFVLAATTVAAVDVHLFNKAGCVQKYGRDEVCYNMDPQTCCSSDEISPLVYFTSTMAIGQDRRGGTYFEKVFAYGNQGDDKRCHAPWGNELGCFTDDFNDRGLISGALWRIPNHRIKRSEAESAVNMSSSSNETSNKASSEDAPKCLGSVKTTHYFANIGDKSYGVKKVDFNRAVFDALESEEEKQKYFIDNADVVKEL